MNITQVGAVPAVAADPLPPSPDGLIEALQAAVGAGGLMVDPDVTAAYSRDMMPLAPSGLPLAVVFPSDTAQEPMELMRFAGSSQPGRSAK